MRIVAIIGGLGSQMFKYAFYVSLKTQCNQKCFIDTTYYLQNNSWNGYELNRVFNIDAEDFADNIPDYYIEKIRTGDESYVGLELKYLTDLSPIDYYFLGTRTSYKHYGIFENLFRIVCRKFMMFAYFCGREIAYPYDYISRLQNAYYDEFPMNSDKYISCIRENLKTIFVFPSFCESKNIETMNRMQNSESIAIHVRRTDHMNDNIKLFRRKFFLKAVNYIKANCNSKPNFYVFSDDINWCKENHEELGLLENDDVTFVGWNKNKNAYKDMQLMTYCQHNIIPISSFSWWGYYLSDRKDKIVCAPLGYWNEIKNHF